MTARATTDPTPTPVRPVAPTARVGADRDGLRGMTAADVSRADVWFLLVVLAVLGPVLVLGARTSDRGVARRARRRRSTGRGK